MKSEEFISSLSALSVEDEMFEKLRKGLPLGVDWKGDIVYARKEKRSGNGHLCVTGEKRGEFIRRLLVTLSCLYEEGEVCFFLLTTDCAYAELLTMRSMDITIPYMRGKSDLDKAIETVKELLRMREYGGGYPRLFILLDGLEQLEGCNGNGDLEEYRSLFELLSRREGVELITGVELDKSIFKNYPAAFVGVGNCLVKTEEEEGKGQVAYVEEDASLSAFTSLTYPSEPTLSKTILFFNLVAEQKA